MFALAALTFWVGYILLGTFNTAEAQPSMQSRRKPNIVMIITDDQDLLMNSLNYQPAVRRHFQDQGTFFEKHYCTIAECCPSRVSLLTGKAAHNTNVTGLREPFGLNEQWLPLWFQQSGYNTYYTGKLMNNHSTRNYDKPFPQGFNSTDFLIDPGTYIYYNATMQSNTDAPRILPGNYSTDVIAARALDFMDEALTSEDPFFLMVAPIGPHGETLIPGSFQNNGTFPVFNPPVPAIRHQGLYQGVKVPRTANFNPDIVSNVSYFKSLPPWTGSTIDYYDEFYRLRLASLAAIDDLVDSIMGKVEQLNILENTYIIYTTDNGFHIGQHRLPAGKSCAIEEDINIPFFIRGPGIAKGVSVTHPTSHTDIAPTLFHLAGIPPRDDFDGIYMPVFGVNNDSEVRQEHINVEFWGTNVGEGTYAFALLNVTNNNTYKALRLISDDSTFNFAYVVWCTNERELYEMNSDPGQLNNIAVDFDAEEASSGLVSSGTKDRNDSASVRQFQSRLDTLLIVLKTCKGNTCTKPWRVMHPDGSVDSLKDAMDHQYDCFYSKQLKIRFDACAGGYLRDLEGPGADAGDVLVWQDGEFETC